MKFLQHYHSFIALLSRRKGIPVVLFAVMLLFNGVIFPRFVPSKTRQPPDIHLHYNARYLSGYLSHLSTAQRRRSLLFHTTADVLYPVIYTLLLSILLFLTGQKERKTVISFPLFIFLFDMLENTGIVILLTSSRHTGLFYKASIHVTPFFTTIKWLCAGITILILLFLAIRHFTAK